MVRSDSLALEAKFRNRDCKQGPVGGRSGPFRGPRIARQSSPATTPTPQGAERPARQGDSERSERGEVLTALDKNASRVSAASVARRQRYQLRDGLQSITTISRVEKCGRCRVAEQVAIRVDDGRAHFSGISSCGSVWCCPVCASKIAARRGAEVVLVLDAHLRAGGGASFLTLTLPHTSGDSLARTRRLASRAWQRVQQGRPWLRLKANVGFVGAIRSLEVTHGANGWHPHVHVLILTERPMTTAEMEAFEAHAFTAWRAYVVQQGHAKPQHHCTTLVPVRDAEVGTYATKFGAALELTQGASKLGRGKESRTAFGILADFLRDGDADDLALWHTWERDMKGARQLTWSSGLKTRFAVEELSDEEVASEAVGGEVVAVMPASAWRLVLALPGLRIQLLEAAEAGGRVAVAAVLAGLPWEAGGLVPP